MSGLHLNHLVSWDELLEFCNVYDDPGIELPICECGRIFIGKKETQLQVAHRKYLADKTCSSLDCKSIGSKIFRKSEKRKIVIPEYIYPFDRYDKEPCHFYETYDTAIHEFAITERQKIKIRNIVQKEELKNYIKTIKKRLSEEGKFDLEDDWANGDWHGCLCYLFANLMENGESDTLLSFPNEIIKEVLCCLHGGQAVGNNMRFLSYHVGSVYLYTNLIFAANLQDKPDEWASMKPNSYFRKDLMHDCDGQTFLYGCRKFLTDEVYMKDFEAMRELCKKSFQFLYFLRMLNYEVWHD